MARESTLEKCAPKKITWGNPFVSIPNPNPCAIDPGARERIPVVIPSDHLRKRGAMMQKVIVSYDKTKMARRRELPCVRRFMALYR
jgi:hypothetical protein